MTAAIVETLAKEFAVRTEHAARVFELLQAGNKAPYIARYHRAEIGDFSDGSIRRFARRLKQFEELDVRRATILRSIEELRSRTGESGPPPEAVLACTDRFELEDHFLPYRRPEPEVQLAIDRGLEALADALVAPAPRGTPGLEPVADEPENGTDEGETGAAETSATQLAGGSSEADEAVHESATAHEDEPAAAESETEPPETESAEASTAEGDSAGAGEPHEAPGEAASGPEPQPARAAFHPAHIDLSPQLARLCAQHVNPDRGVHTEQQALEGAMRILSDRLGRNPELRSLLRRLLRKHARVGVRALVDEGRLGRNRALLRIHTPLRQLQGHRLIALRQAQAQRQVALLLGVDEGVVLPKVRAALGRRIHPDYASVADEVARQALHLRLLPMIEDDVRNELRERADEEALRLVAQHLRQILLTPAAGPRPAAGVHVDAKGDWVIVVVDAGGEPQGAEIKLEASSLALPELAQKLNESMRGTGVMALCLGNGKAARPGLTKLREVLQVLGVEASAVLVNEAGLGHYANSELARSELAAFSVPAREAISLARRYQDPLQEFLKFDPRHLGLGREQLVLGKAPLRRLVHDVVESCVAHVGCDLNRAPLSFLRHVPGLGFESAKKLVERRAARPFASREELRTEGLLDDLAWVNAIGFLRVYDSSEPLDATALHPQQYDLARRVILQGGASVEETLGQRDAAKGLRRADFEVDEFTWRDLVREIAFPGRDPRPRQFLPRLLPPDLDPKTLQKDQVVEGLISSVASFGAFVDVGLAKDALVHISEISHHYVRDARALLSIGQVVRARVTSAGGPRLELSLKNVPDFRRGPPGPRPQRGQGAEEGGERPARTGRRGGRREREEQWPEHQPVLRAARSRRDGLVTGKSGDDRRRGGGGRGRDGERGAGRGGVGAGRGGAGAARGRGASREEYDADAVRRASRPTGSYNPFASFFKGHKDGGGDVELPPSEPPEVPPPQV
ncbi:MAG TPA: Tex-like N-terminal domain-containing protein [Planctomycetota bacterium]